MTQIDQFESVFRSALKDVYRYEPVPIRSVLVVVDGEVSADAYLHQVQSFLGAATEQASWHVFGAEDRFSTTDLLGEVSKQKPDLVCTYRNLHSLAWQHPHSLGEHLDVLLQKAPMPVMITPHPSANRALKHAMKNTNVVMTITNHLSNDHKLVNYAIAFTAQNGTLFLTHFEDEATFDYYMNVISKIPEIDTDLASKKIRDQLLKEPADYVSNCVQTIKDVNLPINLEVKIGFGHRLSDYEQVILQEEVDLLVMNAKDEDQLAMHGLSYPLAIELRQIPLLML